jgi:hypothetical protein
MLGTAARTVNDNHSLPMLRTANGLQSSLTALVTSCLLGHRRTTVFQPALANYAPFMFRNQFLSSSPAPTRTRVKPNAVQWPWRHCVGIVDTSSERFRYTNWVCAQY